MRHDVHVVKIDPCYPEFPFEAHGSEVYEGLRRVFASWGRDPNNPFAGEVGPGGRVVIKPNWVRDYNPKEQSLDSLITHSSIIKHIIDWVAVGLSERGTIVIGDAPLQSCDFGRLMKRSRIGEVVDRARQRYPKIAFAIEDWRLTVMDRFDGYREWEKAAPQAHRKDYEDQFSQNYEVIDLGAGSFLEDIADYADRFRVTCYKPSLMSAHHRPGKHEYLVTKRVFNCDLLINLPKMKTHMKAGLTGAMKNLVGINGHKEYLAHHIKGSYFQGGDCYCVPSRIRTWHDELYDRLWEKYMDVSTTKRNLWMRSLHWLWDLSCLMSGDHIDAGSWSGNETIWRTTLDLNHILYFSPLSPKHIVTIVDGVIAGEGDGPLSPTSKPAGILIGGESPAYLDAVMGRLMGYNLARLPTVYHAIYHRKSRFAGPYLEDFEVSCVLDKGRPTTVALDGLPNLRFVKPVHWSRAEIPLRRSPERAKSGAAVLRGKEGEVSPGRTVG